MTLPPLKDTLEVFQQTVLPAAGGAALVMCAFLLPRRLAALGAAAAIVFGFLCANFTLATVKGDESLTWANTARMIPVSPQPEARAWHWLPRATLVLLIVGLLTRYLGMIAAHYLPERRWWVANVIVWVPRIAVVAVVSGWLTSGKLTEGIGWLWPAVAVAMLLEWVVLDGLVRTAAGAEVAGYQAALFFTAGLLLLYHHWGTSSFLAIALGSAMFGIAVVAALGKSEASGCIPATVGFLPGLLLAGWLNQDSQIPQAAFWLVALAPLVLAPFLLPTLARRDGWQLRIIRAIVALIPLVVAFTLVAQHEKPAFDEY